MQSSQDPFSRLYRIRKTVLEMLHDRDYTVDSDLKEMSLQGFRREYEDREPLRDALTLMVYKSDDQNKRMIVFFAKGGGDGKKKIGITELKEYYSKMKDARCDNGIIVVSNDITPFARKALATLKAKENANIEVFKEESLLINITEHVLVPKHKVLTDQEKNDLLARYHLKPTQLPRISPDDPVARYYGMVVGQVVKIVRPSETAGKYVTYRYVSKTV